MNILQYKTEKGALRKFNQEMNFYKNLHPSKRKQWLVWKPKLEKDKYFWYVKFWS